MDSLLHDVHYGAKMLLRNKGVTVVALLSLSLGIGANVAIFSMANSILLRPLPVANPEQLVQLYVGTRERPYETCSYPSYLDFQARNEVFSGLAASGLRQFTLGDANDVEQVWGEAVSGNYFRVLGVTPFMGRTFAEDEDAVPGRNPVVVLSHGLWRRRFNSDPNLVGRAVTINGHALTVIGIAPPPYTGMMRGLASEVWIPTMTLPVVEPQKSEALLASRGSRWLMLTGRLRLGTSFEQARARFEVLSREMQEAHPEEWRSPQEPSGAIRELFVTVVEEREARIHPGMREDAYGLMALLVGIVNVVLLIACMNLANMLLARGVVRRREFAVRLALGASRLRIIRQLLTESVLLSLFAGAGGVLLAVWVLDLALAFLPALPEGLRVAVDLRPDWRVFLYAAGFSTLTGVLFGLTPALLNSRSDVGTVLKDAAGSSAGGQRRSRTFRVLLASQMAFSLLLLVGAGLVLRSLENVRPTRLGFTSENVLVARLDLNETRYDRAGSQRLYRELSEQVAALPGVQAVTLVDNVPGGFNGRTRRSTEIEGYQSAAGESLHLDFAFVGPRYFANMKVPVVLGRDFDERDREGAPCVAMINEAFAKRYFPSVSAALGKHLAKIESEDSKSMCEIVGIVRDDAWQSLRAEAQPFFALALLQAHRRQMTLLANTAGHPSQWSGAVRRAILGLDPRMPVNDIRTLDEYFSAAAYPFRLLGIALGLCGLMAVLLASIGIYGVVSYSVAQRTRELGIRMALGALRADILQMIVRQGMTLVGCGLLLGLLLSVAVGGLANALFGPELLFGVSATDPLTFFSVTLLLALVALAACALPGLRATKVDPTEALRYE